MSNADTNILLPHLFTGEWIVTKKRKKYSSDDRRITEIYPPKISRIVISKPLGSQKVHAIMYRKDETEGKANDEILEERDLVFKPTNNTLVSEDHESQDRISISFWRYPACDIIFALRERCLGELDCQETFTTIWSAKRAPVESHECPGGLSGKEWNIVLSSGQHAATGKIMLDRLCPRGNPDFKLNLFGLFQIKDDTKILYDVLSYDARVCSFNSIFGVRSLNWQQTPFPGGRVFATFNNTYSLPTARIQPTHESVAQQLAWGSVSLLPDWGKNQEIGRLMDFEIPESQSFADPDSDDPDIGIWVGDPP